MVSDTTETSITWTWNASEGALGYAVQVSHDEMFDDTDQVALTQEASFTAADIPPETSLYLRVAAGTGTPEALAAAVTTGDLSGLALSPWTTHVTGMSAMPPPPPPAPMAPATPTGLMAEGGEGTITWSWEAVEGADGYAIQVSMDEMFDDMDGTTYTTETSHSVADLGYSETRRARVASTSGEGDDMLMSMWTTHMSATTDAKRVPPPPALKVSFSLPDGEAHFLIADPDDNDAETAMADVNAKIMVNSNVDVIITPNFVEGANGVSVMKGDNVPFGRVSWELSQHDVLFGEGAVFMIQRAVIGANQEMEPPGDVAYVTCGPFTCTESNPEQPARPEITRADSAVCDAFAPEFALQYGWVDNDVLVTARAEDTGATPPIAAREEGAGTEDDGLDIGWVTTSKADMTVMHHFEGVADGRNYSVAGRDAAEGTDKALAMDLGDGTANDADKDAGTSNDGYKPALVVMAEGEACADYSDTESPLASARGIDKPESCFRIIGSPDYLSGYSIEVEAKNSAVSWGKVEWEEDPFEELTCGSVTEMAAEHVDIQMLFEEEVAHALDEGEEWVPSVTFNRYTTGTTTKVVAADPGDGETTDTADEDQFRPVEWSAKLKSSPSGRQFKTLWFDDNLDDKLPKKGTSAFKPGRKGLNDLYDANGNTGNIKTIWKSLLDDDGDLDADDLGKVDLVSATDDRSTADDERTIFVEECPANVDNYRPRDGSAYGGDTDDTSDDGVWVVDGQPCIEDADDDGNFDDTTRVATVSTTKTATHPDGRADNYEVVTNADEAVADGGTLALGTAGGVRADVELTARANNRSPIAGAGDFYKCTEVDGGDDDADDNTLCDAEWSYDAEILFAAGTFGTTTMEMVTITCEWDASGELSAGRNRAPNHFFPVAGSTVNPNNLKNFITCKQE